jgi:predicted GNAT superfamily acetyltransferase
MISHQPQSLIIRDIKEMSEMREVEQLQKDVWGVADREIFPALALVPMLEVGGVLIGAFDGERMAGFVFGFPGLENRKAILHSDMLAVRPEYRSTGLGYKLKLAQRARALTLGLDTITWTFDPLQSRNAHLNFGKLGVVADRYCLNYYGETTSFLHQTGTDRLWVTWLLNSERVSDRIDGTQPKRLSGGDELTVLSCAQGGEPVSVDVGASHANVFAIEIPEDINRLLRENTALASRWRQASRGAFTKLLAAGFQVTEFQLAERPHGRVGQYLLTAKPVRLSDRA